MTQNRSELLKQLKLDKSEPVAKASNRGWLLLVVGAAVLGAWLGYFLAEPQPNKTKNTVEELPPQPVVEKRALEETGSGGKILDASGYVTARQVATISAEVMGLILSVDVEEGMFVEKGQLLAQIDDTVAQIQLKLALAQVETFLARRDALQVEYRESQRELKRIQNLDGAGDYASESQLTKAQSVVDRLSANLRSLQAEIVVAKLQVERSQDLVHDHRITAPFAGVVTAKNAQAGEIVAPSSAGGGFTRTGICTIVNMDSLEIEVDVNEAYIGKVQKGLPVQALLDAYPNWPIPARVAAVIPTADRAKATVRVRIEILEKNSKILPDMGVKVSFLSAEG